MGLLWGKHFTVATMSHPPYLRLDQETGEIVGGAAVDTLAVMAAHFGFSHDLWKQREWIFYHPNGSMGGTIGRVGQCCRLNVWKLSQGSSFQVQSGQADFGTDVPVVGYLGMGDLLPALYYRRSAFIELAPKRLSPHLNFLYPLDASIWALILLVIVSMSITLWMISHEWKQEEV